MNAQQRVLLASVSVGLITLRWLAAGLMKPHAHDEPPIAVRDLQARTKPLFSIVAVSNKEVRVEVLTSDAAPLGDGEVSVAQAIDSTEAEIRLGGRWN